MQCATFVKYGNYYTILYLFNFMFIVEIAN